MNIVESFSERVQEDLKLVNQNLPGISEEVILLRIWMVWSVANNYTDNKIIAIDDSEEEKVMEEQILSNELFHSFIDNLTLPVFQGIADDIHKQMLDRKKAMEDHFRGQTIELD